ncbi:hypothetical protein E4T50_13880 [Aureobasidium sp. EXF-12298]|nr:hypothetical protein E4T50_13880 [Aureobasidium sp. EXF-12298]KAI4755009.1 hypothetical protein E4T51_11884 [Aureobasidium sp. EXF-12344]KAI4775658.1 hypothetical protein E4T52_09367 [Aureobasidium sp. EXF-3400]
MAALGASLGRSNGGSPAPTTPRGQASKEINTIIELTAQEFGLPLRPRVGTFSPSKRPDNYAERCVDSINFLFFHNRIVMYDVINQFRKDKAENTIFGDNLKELYSRLREAAYLEKHKPQLGKPQLGGPVVQQDTQFKKPAPKLSLTQTKLIPTIKKRSEPRPAKVKDTENQSPKEKLLPTDQSFLFDPGLASRGTKRLSDQDSCSSSKYVRPQKQRRQQPSLDDHFSYKVSATNPSFTSSRQCNAASIYPRQANQSFATTVASFDGIYDNCDSSSVDYGGNWDPSQAEQLDQLMTSSEPPEYA